MRVLLPMTLAFNVIVPRGAYLLVLLLGNLTPAYAPLFAILLPGTSFRWQAAPRCWQHRMAGR